MRSPHSRYRRPARLGIATATLAAAACSDNTIAAPTIDPNDSRPAFVVTPRQAATFVYRRS